MLLLGTSYGSCDSGYLRRRGDLHPVSEPSVPEPVVVGTHVTDRIKVSGHDSRTSGGTSSSSAMAFLTESGEPRNGVSIIPKSMMFTRVQYGGSSCESPYLFLKWSMNSVFDRSYAPKHLIMVFPYAR